MRSANRNDSIGKVDIIPAQLRGFHLAHSGEQHKHHVIANLLLADGLHSREPLRQHFIGDNDLAARNNVPTPILRKPPDGVATYHRLTIGRFVFIYCEIATLAWRLPSVPCFVGRVNS